MRNETPIIIEALADGRVEQVTVIEIEPEVVEWNARDLSTHNENALQDPRTDYVFLTKLS